MSDREPAVLRDEPAAGVGATPAGSSAAVASPPVAATEPARTSQPKLEKPTTRREPPSVYVVGFWKRLVAAGIDFFVILPVAMLITFIVSKIANIHLPAKNIKLL